MDKNRPVRSRSPVGDTNMPEPIMVPTIRETPEKRPTFRFRFTATNQLISKSINQRSSLGLMQSINPSTLSYFRLFQLISALPQVHRNQSADLNHSIDQCSSLGLIQSINPSTLSYFRLFSAIHLSS